MSTQHILIKNAGEIELGALSLLGATSKKDEPEKIGYFGTGLKYATAFFLRNDIPFRIFSGKEEISITARLQTFRSQNFDVVHINNVPTSITTSMGRDWQLWQAIREIYCNSLDEPESSLEVVEEIEPKAGETRVYIQATGAVKAILADFPKYFCQNTPVLWRSDSSRQNTMLEKLDKEANVYRKGIRVWDTDLYSVFDYNLGNLPIGEDRTVSNDYEIYAGVCNFLRDCDNPDLLSEALPFLCEQGYLEGRSLSGWGIIGRLSPAWKEVVQDKLLALPVMQPFLDPKESSEAVFLPETLFNKLKEQFPNSFRTPAAFKHGSSQYTSLRASDGVKSLITDALLFLSSGGYQIDFPVEVVQFTSTTTLGSIDKERRVILVSPEAAFRPTLDLCATLIEENLHLKTGVKDYTRDFFDKVLHELVSQIAYTNKVKGNDNKHLGY